MVTHRSQKEGATSHTGPRKGRGQVGQEAGGRGTVSRTWTAVPMEGTGGQGKQAQELGKIDGSEASDFYILGPSTG